jgi:hypothetical protein
MAKSTYFGAHRSVDQNSHISSEVAPTWNWSIRGLASSGVTLVGLSANGLKLGPLSRSLEQGNFNPLIGLLLMSVW